MSDLLPFLITGVVTGSLFGLAGLGLVLTFKTTGVFNFAHGSIAALAAYVFYDLRTEVGLPWPVALVAAVVGVGVVAGAVMERLARSLGEARMVLSVVATVGLLLVVQGGLTVRYGSATLPFPAFLPQRAVEVGGVEVTYEQMVVAVVGLAAAVALLVFFRRSRLGMAMRAVVDDPELLSLAALPPTRVRTAAWIVGCTFAALSGVLLASFLGRDPILLTLLVVQAFGAAAVGGFTSLPLTYAGGLVVGVSAALSTKFVEGHAALIGLPATVPFLVLLVALLVAPHRLPTGAIRLRQRATRVPLRWGVRRRLATVAIAGGGLLLVPELVGTDLPVYVNAAVLTPMFLSLALLVWVSGQLSLGHAAFVAFGATTFSHLSSAGIPWLVAVVLAGAAVVPVGALVAIPAIRLSGIYLALATFGFGILMQRMVYSTGLMFGAGGFRSAPRPDLWFIHGVHDRDFFLVAAGVAAVCMLLAAAVQRSRLGRILRALGDSPAALSSLGADANLARLLVFCIAGFFAGVSGALSISATSSVSGDTYGLQQSLLWLTVLGICGSNLLLAPVAAALLFAVSPTYLPASLIEWQPVLFGVAAIGAAVALDRAFRIGPRSRGRGERSPIADRFRRPLRSVGAEVAT